MSTFTKSIGGCVILCELSPLQKDVYQAFLEHEDFELIAASQLICSCGSGEKQGYCCRVNNRAGKSWFQLVPSCTALLLKCANHLALVFPSPNRPGSEWVSALFQRAFQKFPTLIGLSKAASPLTLSDRRYCGKIKVLEQMLSKMKRKCSKVLLCTHSNRLCCALEEALLDNEFAYTRLDNMVPREERELTLERFHRDATKLVLLVLAVDDLLPATLHCDSMIIFDPCLSTSSVSGDRTCPWCFTDFHPMYKLVALGTVEEVLHVRQAAQKEDGSPHSQHSRSSSNVFSYNEAFTLHSSSVSASLSDWKVTSKTVDGVSISQLTFLRNPSSDSGIGDTTSQSGCSKEWAPNKESMPPVAAVAGYLPTCTLRNNKFEDASSESDDLTCQAVTQASAAAETEDGAVWPQIDEQQQKRKVTGKRLRTKAPVMQRKKKVCRGLVYESDLDENIDSRKVSTATKKRSSPSRTLSKMKLATVPCKKAVEDSERLLGVEPLHRESPLQASVLVEPNLGRNEPFDAMESIDLFTPPEEDLPVTELTGPPVNLDELFGF